jgi:hypothetical protein
MNVCVKIVTAAFDRFRSEGRWAAKPLTALD